MASVPYEVIAASKPFRFLVGPDKKEFLMHAELVGRISKPLWTLVNGDWQEGKTGLAEWPEIDEGTFVRFCEFAYTGDYRAAEPFIEVPTPPTLENGNEGEASTSVTTIGNVEIEDVPDVSEELDRDNEPYPEPVKEDPWGWGTTPKGKKKKRPSCQMLVEPAPEIDWSPPPPPSKGVALWKEFKQGVSDNEPYERPKEQSNTNPLANFSEVLLSHARLYALADCYDINALMELCLRKLQRTLKTFNLHKGARVTDVVQLLDYSYKNTQDKASEKDKLRSLLATYVACHVEELWPCIYFQDVLESSGEVSKAIIGQLLRRID